MIKTILAGEALTRAIARHERWLDRDADAHAHNSRELVDRLERVRARRQPLTFRMAKATVPTDGDRT